MTLDLTTLYAIAALGALITGMVHVLPWVTRRFGHWSAYWGFGHLLIGSTALAGILHDQFVVGSLLVRLSNPALVFGYMLLLAGMRTFERSRAPVLPLFLLAALLGLPLLLFADPSGFSLRVAYLSVIRAGIDIAIVLCAVRIARREDVHTGWIVAMLFTATVPLFLGRGWLALMGQVGTQPTGMHHGLAAWLAAGQIAFVVFRAFSLLILKAERGQKALAEQICRDPLTGALNRLGFERLIAPLSGTVCIMMIDIDHFKQLNDRHGHAAGDTALRRLAGIAQDVLAEDGVLVRWGGDEFVYVLPGNDGTVAPMIARAIGARFTEAMRHVVPDHPGASLSIGHAAGPIDGAVDDLLHRADATMYRAKRDRPPAPYASVA